jgi:hypothetical protein
LDGTGAHEQACNGGGLGWEKVTGGGAGRKVVDGEGVDVDELRAHAVLLELVVGPKVHER